MALPDYQSLNDNLKGRIALLTGATGHLGRYFSTILAKMGVNLILIDQDEKMLAALTNDLKYHYKIKTTIKALNFSELETLQSVQAIIEEFHKSLDNAHEKTEKAKIDILINNAGFVGTADDTGWNAPFHDQSLNSWQKAMDINLTAPFCLTQFCLQYLQQSDQARIINIGSIYAHNAPRNRLYEGVNMHLPAAYSASKAGLVQFTSYLASTLAPDIIVNAISPGGIERGQDESFIKSYCRETPLGRMAHEDDFAGALLFLASHQSSYMTGQNLVIDGGFGL